MAPHFIFIQQGPAHIFEQTTMAAAGRKINFNIFGIVLILALAAYSLFCLYVGTVTLTCFSKLQAPPIVRARNNFSRTSTITNTIRDIRPEFIIKWSKVIGVPSYKDLKIDSSQDLETAKIIGYIAFGCFILASLLQSYVALRALFQPSFTVGSNGANVKPLK